MSGYKGQVNSFFEVFLNEIEGHNGHPIVFTVVKIRAKILDFWHETGSTSVPRAAARGMPTR